MDIHYRNMSLIILYNLFMLFIRFKIFLERSIKKIIFTKNRQNIFSTISIVLKTFVYNIIFLLKMKSQSIKSY